MDSFEDLYCTGIQYLQNILNRPALCIGNIRTLSIIKETGQITALLLSVSKRDKISPDRIEKGLAIPLTEAIKMRPTELTEALMSWMVFTEEDEPSTLLIHRGITPENLKVMSYTRLFQEIPTEKMTNEHLKKVRERAEAVTLTEPRKVEESLV